VIRTAKLSDLDRLVELERECFDPTRYSRMSSRQFRHHLTNPRCVFLVAADNHEKAVGYALGFLHSRRSALRFYSLAVFPYVQRGEIGRLLFERMEHEAFTRGLGVQCEVRADNEKLKTRYSRLGYAPYKTVENYYPDGEPCIKYIKSKDNIIEVS
jgi:ribosomal protein S18 acetylase RimI-like enzyme